MSNKEEFKTEQEEFWAGSFGNNYTERNVGDKWIASNTSLFSKILSSTNGIKSICEFGSNRGLNLVALKNLIPDAKFSAIEINKQAINELKSNLKDVKVYPMSIFDFIPDVKKDFVFIKGVLIHINPNKLQTVYKLLFESSNKYICIIEYYNPTPVTISYRGYDDRLFKRDFVGEIMKKYENLKLVDYGFVYHNDPNFPQDDITWFLLEK